MRLPVGGERELRDNPPVVEQAPSRKPLVERREEDRAFDRIAGDVEPAAADVDEIRVRGEHGGLEHVSGGAPGCRAHRRDT